MHRCSKGEMTVSGSKDYRLRVHGQDGFPDCQCMAFVMNRNKRKKELDLVGKNSTVGGTCKHLDWHLNEMCDWQGEPRLDGKCPKCGADTVEAVVETFSTGRVKGTAATEPAKAAAKSAKKKMPTQAEIDADFEKAKEGFLSILNNLEAGAA